MISQTAAATPPGRLEAAAARAIATVFGLGYSRVAPGTLGTAAAVPLAWALRDASVPTYLAVTAGVMLLGIWAASVSDLSWGTHDDRRIVIDEVAGYLVTALPIARHDPFQLLLAFAVFRLLDVLKPWPACVIDRSWRGGAGVVLDDVAAAVWGALLCWLIVGAF